MKITLRVQRTQGNRYASIKRGKRFQLTSMFSDLIIHVNLTLNRSLSPFIDITPSFTFIGSYNKRI